MNRFLDRRRLFVLAVFTIAVLAANLGTVRSVIAISDADETASHLVLVPFVTMALLWRLRRNIGELARISWSAGAPIILVGFALIAAGRVNGLSASAAGLAISWIGAFVLLYGPRAARAALFPLLFLLLVIPPPPRVLASATAFLKSGSAETVARLLDVARIPYNRDGFVFALPGVTIEIADECSGIRSSIALMLTGLIATHLMLGTTWKKIAFIAVIVPIAVLKNAIRIVGLSLLAIYVDAGFLEGRLHHEGGIVFFLIGLALLGPILLGLQRSEGVAPRRAAIEAGS